MNDDGAGDSTDAVPGAWPGSVEPSNRLAPRQRSSWLAETFVDSTEAEIALCNERADFIKQQHIMPHVPNHIKKLIAHHDSVTHIRAFEQLFVHLGTQEAGDLHQFVIEYFYDTLPLRSHLSQSFVSQYCEI